VVLAVVVVVVVVVVVYLLSDLSGRRVLVLCWASWFGGHAFFVGLREGRGQGGDIS
jgi:hypothetical protein